ncbi:sn-glycerol-3-phosphate import ATP-binding protein UgpC [Variibacter gotjawalensis]|uniref:sn-glycerol-3-phosphate import ATP-binding protein UgpC n=1 Tax=Variibacter gotjawalensis TaxID=1333996 RepID=A0A0S3Q0G0_9BRAD|nr:sn-glycerol-3-phosphate ABC transporter ATP-binding protein UgpC [Variibacter gotjawalensis]NIK47471.1 multiple sugar transport system ATP-binding protein [Variibacter gotjawalensis]RZS49366.1 carbohydrate ABC transporter ATP-binding protein (CUT1 family) [Variibacter gotjawalensis]BAT61630.1 sn-glycerol-3-phosphate import ATP-binding protein UgpC [Variibacter gotjawalensis]
MGEVVLSQLVKSYPGGVTAVRSIDLKIPDGAFAVLVGPSGCGKSTTLRMIAGLEEISSGTISIGGRVVNKLPPKDRDIAMVFQNYALYQHMTVYDNLAFGLRNRGENEQAIAEKIAQAAGILSIEPLLKRRPKQLSGGQQQRVALGRCIVRHPQVFLFDEPLSNLDAKLRAHMRIELKRLRERVPVTSVYVTHDQVEAMTLGDLVVIMKDGLVQQVGTPLEVYNTPANLFVASFIGAPAMNILQGTVDASGETVNIEGFSLRVGEKNKAALRGFVGKPVTVGIRPEHIALGGNGNDVDGIVDVIEQLGSEMHLDMQIGKSHATVARVAPDAKIAVKQGARLSINPDAMHFFEPDTQNAIRITH